jgi:hypothetical protein
VLGSVELAWPRRLNHPVSHAANGDHRGGASIPAQKYGPPLVGIAETISAMAMATSIVKNETTIQLMEITARQQPIKTSSQKQQQQQAYIPAGPPVFNP